MALILRDGYRYGDSQADIKDEIARYSELVGYKAEHFADARCICGGAEFTLLLDDASGVAVRKCISCGADPYPMGDSGDFLDDAEVEECACPCTSEVFELTVGVALYEGSQDVRWMYIGCRCRACKLTAVYGDWKNEFENYRALLARI